MCYYIYTIFDIPVYTSLTIHNQIDWQHRIRVVNENRLSIVSLRLG